MNSPLDHLFAAEEQQAHAVKAARQSAEEHGQRAISMLMESRSGRIFVRDFLNFCGVFASPALKSTEQVHFSEGLRLAGMYLFVAVVRHDTANVTKIFNEEEQQ